jgi:hypothetical protein
MSVKPQLSSSPGQSNCDMFTLFTLPQVLASGIASQPLSSGGPIEYTEQSIYGLQNTISCILDTVFYDNLKDTDFNCIFYRIEGKGG